MRVLLDTHILLWALGEPAKLPPQARQAIIDPTNEILFSAVSIWEIAIKSQLRRRDFAADVAEGSGGVSFLATVRGQDDVAYNSALRPPSHRWPRFFRSAGAMPCRRFASPSCCRI